METQRGAGAVPCRAVHERTRQPIIGGLGLGVPAGNPCPGVLSQKRTSEAKAHTDGWRANDRRLLVAAKHMLRMPCQYTRTPRTRREGIHRRSLTKPQARTKIGRRAPLPHLQGRGSPRHRGWAHPCNICNGLGLTPATTALGPGSPRPNLHRDRTHPSGARNDSPRLRPGPSAPSSPFCDPCDHCGERDGEP